MGDYLFGFPGETPESYLGQPDLLSKIVHLAAPVGCGRVRFDRFSPYHNSPAEFGVTELTPYPAYSYVYPGLVPAEISKLAYYFVGKFAGQEQINSYTAAIVEVVEKWQQSQEEVTLCHSTHEGRTTVFDGRDGTMHILILENVFSLAFERCSTIVGERVIAQDLARDGYEKGPVGDALKALVAHGLVMTEGERYLSLSIPLGFGYYPPERVRKRIALQMQASQNDENASVTVPSHMCTVMR